MYIKNEICSQHLIKMEKRYIKECLKKVKERKCFVYSQVHPTSLTRDSPPPPPPSKKKYLQQIHKSTKQLAICKHDRRVFFFNFFKFRI